MSGSWDNIIVWLVLLPMFTGLTCVPLVNRPLACRAVGLLGSVGTLLLAATLLITGPMGNHAWVSQMGDWAAPYGITLIFDALSGLMLVGGSLVAVAALIYSFGSLPARTERRYFHPLVHFLMMGVNLSFLTGDLFNLFVAFEVMLMSSYGLLVIGGGRAQLRHGYKYVVLNLVASSVFVIAAGMAYGMFGTLNMADLSRVTAELAADDALPVGYGSLGLLLLFVFTLKAGVFPLWFWLPDTYPNCPTAVAGLFGGVLTKVGLYAIMRTYPLIFLAGGTDGPGQVLRELLVWGAGLTMLVGVLGALAYVGLRRVFSMLLIVGVGYSLLGIAVVTAGSLAGAAFYMTQSMLVMAGLFFCGGLVERLAGSDDTTRMGGLLQRPGTVGLGVMVIVLLLAAVGLPPTSGFYGKLAIIREALGSAAWFTGVIALLVGGLTLLAALRIWGHSFWGPAVELQPPHPAADRPTANIDTADPGPNPPPSRATRSEWCGAGLLVTASVLLGLVPEPIMATATRAGHLLAEGQPYRAAVLVQAPAANAPAPKAHGPAAGVTPDPHSLHDTDADADAGSLVDPSTTYPPAPDAASAPAPRPTPEPQPTGASGSPGVGDDHTDRPAPEASGD